ncbi:MAG: carboxypeptidase-like regulatory domain-containing protein [Bacteroidota bacterium]|nr:carboxypeptidase-like regulatory domain-containing protein [Bacteroidota bacterium]
MPRKLLLSKVALVMLCSPFLLLQQTAALNKVTESNKFLKIAGIPAFDMLFKLQVTVKGKVTDATDGSALPGVSVATKGTSKGTITDANGTFTLNDIADDDVLVFSMVGYQALEMPVNGRSELNIQLAQDVASLNEVVVTALGIKKEKKALGYAVQEVAGETLVKARENNVMSSLTGKVAGLTVTNSTDLFQAPTGP